MELTLERADRIVEAAFAKAAELGAAPLTVAVLDRGGHVIELRRQDRCAFLRPEIAVAKAWGALGLGVPTAAMARVAAERPAFFQALSALSGGRVVPVPGGVLVRDADGDVIGAVGVSGDTSETDEACALAGIEAAGFARPE